MDAKRGIVYFPTASPKYKLYGADRSVKISYARFAARARCADGQTLWHFQIVHHDVWDYDTTTSPKLADDSTTMARRSTSSRWGRRMDGCTSSTA